MDFIDVVQQRTSIRNFSDRVVEQDTLKSLCRIGSLAPSVSNFQPWRFVGVTNSKILSKIAQVIADKIQALPSLEHEFAAQVKNQVEYFSTFFEKAPAVIFVFVFPYESVLEKGIGLSHEEVNRMRSYPDMQTIGACVENILLGAVDMGMGACWMSSPLIAKKEIADMLNVDGACELASMVAVGYPKSTVPPKTKKEIDTIFEFVE